MPEPLGQPAFHAILSLPCSLLLLQRNKLPAAPLVAIHVATSKSCFYHIRSFRQIRSSVDHIMAISVASALVSSRLDYANSVLFGCPQKHAARLQRVQQAIARVVMQHYSNPLFLHLHPPNFLNNFTGSPSNGESDLRLLVHCSVHKILNTGHPPYLNELLQYHKPARSTRSSASHLLSVPRHNLSFGARAFRVAAPKIRNSIPLHIRQSQTYSSFRRHLKTHYFISAHLAH